MRDWIKLLFTVSIWEHKINATDKYAYYFSTTSLVIGTDLVRGGAVWNNHHKQIGRN